MQQTSGDMRLNNIPYDNTVIYVTLLSTFKCITIYSDTPRL